VPANLWYAFEMSTSVLPSSSAVVFGRGGATCSVVSSRNTGGSPATSSLACLAVARRTRRRELPRNTAAKNQGVRLPARLGFLFALLFTLVSSEARAFCRTTTDNGGNQGCVSTGKPLFWSNACIGYYVQETGTKRAPADAIAGVLKDAFGSWTALSCGSGAPSISLQSLGVSKSERIGFDKTRGAVNENLILFRDASWPYPDQSQVALTTLTYRKDTGELVDADMEVNGTLNLVADGTLTRNGFDLRTVFAHEGGHVFGLAHTSIAKATMFASYDPGTSDQRVQKPDDIAAICDAYPADGTRKIASGTITATACDPRAILSLEEPQKPGCSCSATPPSKAASSAQEHASIALLLACLCLLLTRRSHRTTHTAIETR
jgi:Matrixin